jgi:alkylhydroperoxidase family enzyme
MTDTFSINNPPSEQSKEILEKVQNKFGFIPNQDKILAISPSIHKAYIQAFDLFLGSSTLGLLEGQIVIMTVSYENNSPYCMAVHSWGMEMTGVSREIINALREGKPINDKRLELLRIFTRELMVNKGNVTERKLQEFIHAGFTNQNVIEIIGGIATKLISNLTNIIAKTPLDEQMTQYKWTHPHPSPNNK